MVQELTKNDIKQLKKTARKFLNDKSKSDEEKVNILFHWSGQISLDLNDHNVRLMKTKDKGQKYLKFSLNIQLGTDTKSKLICGVNAVQIPALMNKILTNLNSKPSKISADTIYLTLVNWNYLDNLGICFNSHITEKSGKFWQSARKPICYRLF